MEVSTMSSLLDSEQRGLAPGEAYQRCIQELDQPHPDYQAAQVFAMLSLEETMREVLAGIAHLTKSVVIASRRR
jgi:hypothetical protein